MDRHVISIHEQRPKKPTETRSCRVRISIDGVPRAGYLSIQDPFGVRRDPSEEDPKVRHGRLAWYLEDALADTRFNQEKADRRAEATYAYLDILFNSLELKGDVSKFGFPNVEVNVFAHPKFTGPPESEQQTAEPGSYMSILEIYWELLELKHDKRAQTLWGKKVSRVSVQRIVPKQPPANLNDSLTLPNVPRVVPWSQITMVPAETECRVLLVIARRPAQEGVYEISPSYIECALLQLFERLNAKIKRDYYQLEVVRPGSFAELKRHLERNKQRPFQMVHFDMHGIVRCQKEDCGLPRSTWRLSQVERSCAEVGNGHIGRAFLIFAGLGHDNHLSVSEYPADDIAETLQQTNIRCVALNACESARTNDGDAANLSYTFLQKGVSNVIAMSFRISDVMFVKYYREFYRALFDRGHDFATAAARARLALQYDRERDDADNYKIDMEDWFVPVTYCDENILQMKVPEPQEDSDNFDKKARDRERKLEQGQRAVLAMKIAGIVMVALSWMGVLLAYRRQYQALVLSVLLLSLGTGSLLFLLNVSSAMLRLRFVRSPTAEDIQCDTLDNNMLIIESELKNKRHQPLVLHGLSSIPDSLSLIDNLAFVWGRTNFIDLIVVIPSAWFYQPRPIQIVRRWYCRLVHYAYCCHGEKFYEKHIHPPEKTMVIITDLELVFPEHSKTKLNWLQSMLQPFAQKRLLELFEQHFKDEEASQKTGALVVSSGNGKPYLFLSGNGSLEDERTLTATLDDLKVMGLNSVNFVEVGEYRSRMTNISEYLRRDPLAPPTPISPAILLQQEQVSHLHRH